MLHFFIEIWLYLLKKISIHVWKCRQEVFKILPNFEKTFRRRSFNSRGGAKDYGNTHTRPKMGVEFEKKKPVSNTETAHKNRLKQPRSEETLETTLIVLTNADYWSIYMSTQLFAGGRQFRKKQFSVVKPH